MKSLLLGVLGAVIAGVILWGIKSWFPAAVSWLFKPDVPPGAVMAFTKSSCPSGWTRHTDSEGRFILGWSGDQNLPEPETRAFRPFDDDGGAESVTINVSQMPSHHHAIKRTNSDGDGLYVHWGSTGQPHNQGTGAEDGTTDTGGNQPHANMPPYIALTYCEKT